ncbi:MAG: sigma-70 family RNA polymerase sigma factor [Bacteroidota bacterium]
MSWFLRPKSESQYSSLSDEQLLKSFQGEGDAECIGELFKRYTHLVLGVCMKFLKDEEVARDAVMQIFGDLLAKPPDKEVLNIKAWLFAVSRNYCLMQLRHFQTEARMRDQKLQELQAELMESPSVMHLYEEEEALMAREKILKAVMKLNYEQRRCVQLFFLEEKTYQEITDLTGYNFRQVKSYIQNGKRNLKMMLDHGSSG